MDFSIIIPTYNRPAQLGDCLAALARLDYPRDRFEVVVVDDGGSSPLQPMVEPFSRRLSLRLLSAPHGGPAAARNRGAAAAQGRTLAFTDDDCAPARDWLTCLQARNQKPGTLLGGRTVNAIESQLAPAASQILIDYLYQHYNRDHDDARFIVSCNLAVPADAFRELGGFDASFPKAAAEDRDLCDRWRARGWRMAYLPEAIVFHRHALSLGAFWRQHFDYGRGAFRFHRARLARQQDGILVESLPFYSRLLAYPFTSGVRKPARVSALLAVSQAANAAGFFTEAILARERRES